MEQFLIWSGVAFWLIMALCLVGFIAGRLLIRFGNYPLILAWLYSVPAQFRRHWRAHKIATTWQDRKASPSRH
jgi:hypothetical protein